MVLAGHPSKNIAADLHISQRTVENHRASIMKRTGSKLLPDLARLALAAASIVPADHSIDDAALSDMALVHLANGVRVDAAPNCEAMTSTTHGRPARDKGIRSRRSPAYGKWRIRHR